VKCLLLYATTSGATRCVVETITEELGRDDVIIHDLAALDRPLTFGEYDLVILATPTYGRGDWHYWWQEKGGRMLASLSRGKRVALLALGDSRGHKSSFGGGLAHLAKLARSKHASIIGAVSSAEYQFQASAALEDGSFPGLILEYRRDRYKAVCRARQWIRALQDRSSRSRV
jgi:flavodoxin I